MIEQDINRIIVFGPLEISKGSCTITLDEIEHKVSPRSMDVLIYLIENSDRIVTTTELLHTFWSSIASDHTIHKAIAELRAAMGDSVRRQRHIKTVPKRGYKIIGDVISDSAAKERGLRAFAQRIREDFELANLRQWAVGIVVLGVLLSLAWFAKSEPRINRNDAVVIGIPPFGFESNGDDSNQYMVNGLTNTLINELSNLNSISVSAMNETNFNASTSRLNNADSSSALSHVLQGTLIQADGQLRVLINLVRTQDGIYEFSGRFDMDEGSLFTIQDAIISNIVSAVEIHLDDGHRANMQAWGTDDAIAYDRFLKAEFHNAQFNPDDWQKAIDFYQEAIALDPSFISAYLGLSTAANNYSVFAKINEKKRLITLVAQAHRSISAIDRHAPSLDLIRAIEARLAGNEYRQEESMLREQILSGTPPEFAIPHYALLLMSARLYDEAERFLDKTSELGPFEISPDEIWSYRVTLLPSAQAIAARKLQLQERPKHIGFLGEVSRDLTVIGRYAEAFPFLERQRLADSQGPSAQLSKLIVDIARGEITRENAPFLIKTDTDQDSHYANGIASLMLGDLQAGSYYWQSIHPLQKRWLLNLAHIQEIYLPKALVNSHDYQTLLETLDVGKSWQRTMMEGVMALEEVTGIPLSETAADYYQRDTFMQPNNLWDVNIWPADSSIAKLALNQL